ncbi:hypothetical protein B0H14DRAFT_3011849 [Mycena olivaceomarginata]|nr:hypothetical protein B0H14DRAFT_3011849 [Mycena olivaceomarginata]
MAEGNLLGYEPRCMVWYNPLFPGTRTDQLIRMETAINGTTCGEAAHALHHAPCEDARDGPLSQCEMNLEVRADLKFENMLAHSTREFGDEMRKSFGVPPFRPIAPWIRAASDALTMAMTILYGLEKLNGDDAWTRKCTLTVHVSRLCFLFMWCFPILNDQRSSMVLCGPEMPQSIISVDCKTCSVSPEVVTQLVLSTYHNFVQKKGSDFERPDLCIAFNSAAHPIPTLFTAYDREEAEIEATLLRAAGATLHSALGPSKNPWGSMNPIPAAHRQYGFYTASGWLAGGFK